MFIQLSQGQCYEMMRHEKLRTHIFLTCLPIMGQLNHRHRKTFGLKTPYELFFKINALLTVVLHT
jgi:hypothetical protein